MKMEIRHWATACKNLFEHVRKTNIEFQYVLYVNYPAFATPEAKIEEKNIWLYKRIRSDYEMVSEPQRMFPCFAREATQALYDIMYAKVFWIYPVKSSCMLFLEYQERFYLVDWMNFTLDGIQLVSSDLLHLPPPISTIDFPVGLLSDFIFFNAKYYSAPDDTLV